jgi:hypothetical protein
MWAYICSFFLRDSCILNRQPMVCVCVMHFALKLTIADVSVSLWLSVAFDGFFLSFFLWECLLPSEDLPWGHEWTPRCGQKANTAHVGIPWFTNTCPGRPTVSTIYRPLWGGARDRSQRSPPGPTHVALLILVFHFIFYFYDFPVFSVMFLFIFVFLLYSFLCFWFRTCFTRPIIVKLFYIFKNYELFQKLKNEGWWIFIESNPFGNRWKIIYPNLV